MLNVLAAIHGTGVAASTNSYESIATVTVGSPTTTVTFSSIPSTYKNLQLRFTIGNEFNIDYTFLVWLNSDTTAANYAYHILKGNGATATAAGGAGYSGAIYFGGNATYPQSGVLDLLDYTNTNKYTTARVLGGYDANGSGNVYLSSLLWKNTAAVNTLTVYGELAKNFVTGSKLALYGIKG